MKNPLSVFSRRHALPTPMRMLSELQSEMDRWFDDRFSDLPAFRDGLEFVPVCDVEQPKDAYLLKVDLPGVKPEDAHVESEGNVITIRGERKHETVQEDSKRRVSESYYGSFSRSLTLPEAIADAQVKAEFRDGVL